MSITVYHLQAIDGNMCNVQCVHCSLYVLIVVDGKYSINKYNRRQRRRPRRQRWTVQLKRPPHLYHMYMQTIDKQNDRLLSILVRFAFDCSRSRFSSRSFAKSFQRQRNLKANIDAIKARNAAHTFNAATLRQLITFHRNDFIFYQILMFLHTYSIILKLVSANGCDIVNKVLKMRGN